MEISREKIFEYQKYFFLQISKIFLNYCKIFLRRYKKTEYSQEELRKTFTEELHMGVVRLAGGSLLLYSPVQIT